VTLSRTHNSVARRSGAALFGLAVQTRNAAYGAGLFPVRRVDGVTVVSVGNLRSGGSGKTPLAMCLAAMLRDAGLSTCLLLRGYRGALESRGGVVSRGTGPLVSPGEAGDEAYMAASRLKGVSVRVGADRIHSAIDARNDGARVIVLDDGFQHRRLHRDLDILLVCPEDLDDATALVPAGPLREPSSAARRAHLTGGLQGDWEGVAEPPPLLVRCEPGCLLRGISEESLEEYQGVRAHLLAGVARPERFERTATEAGLDVTGTSFFPDHHRFHLNELEEVERAARAESAEVIVTTEKDLPRVNRDAVVLPLRALRIEARIHAGALLLDQNIERIISGSD